MTRQYFVAQVSEIAPGAKKLLEVGGHSIGVYNVAGQFYALRNVCPHQGAELCKGLTTALIVSSGSGTYGFEREGEIVRCPWHQYEFDMKTGCMIVDASQRTKTYEVTVDTFGVSVEEGKVFVHI